MRNYILSIDGNYESDFEVEHYFHLMNKFSLDNNLQITKFHINSSSSVDKILEELNKIKDLCVKDGNFIQIVGGLAEPVISDLLKVKQIDLTFEKYEEVARVYSQIAQRNQMVNILLIDPVVNKELKNGFDKIDSMNLSVGFDFSIVDVSDLKILDRYAKILDIVNDKGWRVAGVED